MIGRARFTPGLEVPITGLTPDTGPFLLGRKTLPASKDSHWDLLPTWSPGKAMRNKSDSSPDPRLENYQRAVGRKPECFIFQPSMLSTCVGWGLGNGIRVFRGLLKRNSGQKRGQAPKDSVIVSLSLPAVPSTFHSWSLSVCNGVLFMCDCRLSPYNLVSH